MPSEPGMVGDPKPAGRVKNPALLRRVKEAYRSSGCAHCGRRVGSDPPPGFDIEVHHVLPRGRGGDDSWMNTVGLCGELAGCRAHHFVHRGRWKIVRADGALWLSSIEFAPRRLEQIGAEL